MKEFDPIREFIFDYITVVAGEYTGNCCYWKHLCKRCKYQLCLLFPAICTCVNLYASLYPNLSEGRYDCKADITAKRNRTCGIGDCNVSCHSFCDV